MRYDAVFWDMDGVLIDSEPHYATKIREMYARHGVTLTTEQERSFVGASVYSNAPRILEWYPHVTATADALIEQHTHALLEGLMAVPSLISGVDVWASRLRDLGVLQAVASSSTGIMLDYARERFKLCDIFDGIVCAADVPIAKPAPDIFIEAARRFGIAPLRCLVIEDSQNGVSAAHAARMKAAVFTGAPGMGAVPSNGDYTFSRYDADAFFQIFGETL